jgi:hypothetical protein
MRHFIFTLGSEFETIIALEIFPPSGIFKIGLPYLYFVMTTATLYIQRVFHFEINQVNKVLIALLNRKVSKNGFWTLQNIVRKFNPSKENMMVNNTATSSTSSAVSHGQLHHIMEEN